ncbi:RRM domain-containing protein [Entamoeba marina]
MSLQVVAVNIPLIIDTLEVNDILLNCGQVMDMKQYKIANMVYDDGKYDLLLTLNKEEDVVIITGITGATYRNWRVKIMKLESYKSYKIQEKIDYNTQITVQTAVSDFVCFLKGVPQTKTNPSFTQQSKQSENVLFQPKTTNYNEDVVVVNSDGQQLYFKKKKKALPPLPTPKATSDELVSSTKTTNILPDEIYIENDTMN